MRFAVEPLFPVRVAASVCRLMSGQIESGNGVERRAPYDYAVLRPPATTALNGGRDTP
jgi:hypothetical protein